MKRKLVWVNLLLLGLTAATAVHLRRQWVESHAGEQAILQRRIRPAPPPHMAPLPAAAPVKAAGYIDIAQKMLFSKDRNPTVVVEPPPPPKPKPMPPLPVFHGLVDIGDGPTAIMSEKPGAQHRDYRPGEQVGEFKLVALDSEEIVLEWDGNTITRKVDEMIDRSVGPPPAPSKATAAAAPPPVQPAAHADAKPGADIGGRGIKGCTTGDSSPAGTVADGFRKVIKESPFGKSCFWEPN